MTPPLCPACPHTLHIHGPDGCVAASGCGCRTTPAAARRRALVEAAWPIVAELRRARERAEGRASCWCGQMYRWQCGARTCQL